jgi:hypothetical protein
MLRARLGRLGAALSLAMLTSLLLVPGSSAAWAAGVNCSDFSTQAEAQRFFVNHGGPHSDPEGLDADGDGIACESLPCPCSAGGPPPTAPPRPSVVKSRVSLTLDRSAAIAGEAVRLRVRVSPKLRRTVVLQRRQGDHWVHLRRAGTTRTGVVNVSTRMTPKRATYRAVVVGRRIGPTWYTAATSAHRVVRPQAQRLRLYLGASRVRTGHRMAPVAVASPVRTGRRVQLQRWTSWGWIVVDDGRQTAYGRVRFSVQAPSRAGDYRYRAVTVRSAAGAQRVHSGQARLAVVKPVDETPPPVPRIVTAQASDGIVTVEWTPVSAPDLAGYQTRIRDEGGTFDMTTQVDAGTTVTTFAERDDALSYVLTVRSLDRSGNLSEWSDPVRVTSPIESPSGPLPITVAE